MINYKKSYGQNFIFDKNLLDAIVKDSSINKNSIVLEVGAGVGTLSKAIAKVANKLITYEIDTSLKQELEKNLQSFDNVQIIWADFLKKEIEIEDNFEFVANVPYYIVSKILFKLFLQKNLKSITITVQKEFGERMCAKKGSSNYGILSVACSCYGTPIITRTIKRECFHPIPKVDSVVVHMQIKKVIDYFKIKSVVSASFAMKRKTLINNLSKAFLIEKEELFCILEKRGIEQKARAEELDLEDFIFLALQLKKQ